MFCTIYSELYFYLLYPRIGGKIGMFHCDPELIMVMHICLFGMLEPHLSCNKSILHHMLYLIYLDLLFQVKGALRTWAE